jgi:hypothetical protein
MGTEKDQAKQAKKEAKARAKALKKMAAPDQQLVPDQGAAGPLVQASDGISPAERSARAAEKQVELQRKRVLIAALGIAIGLATLAVTLLLALD